MKNNIFLKILGNSSQAKILDYILDINEYAEVSTKDIMNATQMTWKTTTDTLNKLCEEKILTNTRTIGRVKMYALNMDSKISQNLITLNKTILKEQAEKNQEDFTTTRVSSIFKKRFSDEF